MRNVVTIDLIADKVIDIAMEEAESNSIAIKYINAASEGSSPKVEFYKPEQYCGYVAFEEGQEEYTADVPEDCINDGHIFHFRHISDKRAHKYFHITGNISKFDSMMLILTGDCVLKMTGTEKSEPTPSPDPPPTPTPSGGTILKIDPGNDDTELPYGEIRTIGIIHFKVLYYVNEKTQAKGIVNDMVKIKCLKNKETLKTYTSVDWS